MLLATTTGDGQAVARGVVLATAYCLGLGLPFVLVAAGFQRFGRLSAALRRHQRGIQLFGGALLLAVGVLLLTGLWEDLTRALQTQLVTGFETVI
jgi:cytochrome c-type biogenesis protein